MSLGPPPVAAPAVVVDRPVATMATVTHGDEPDDDPMVPLDPARRPVSVLTVLRS